MANSSNFDHTNCCFGSENTKNRLPRLRKRLQSTIQTATPFLGALILRGFREPSSATAIPNLPRSTYFAWFSCPQQRHSDAQPSPEHVFCVFFESAAAPRQRPTFPGARILRPRPSPAHVFYVFCVLKICIFIVKYMLFRLHFYENA